MKIKATKDFLHVDKTIKKGEEITVKQKYADIYTRLGFAKEVQETNTQTIKKGK